MIALGGCIGTGFFIGSGVTLLEAGPGSLLIGYLAMSIVMFFVMNILGEMTTFLPIAGNGAQTFVGSYFEESLGFAIGYNYWYAFAILVATEITAAAIIIEYWITSINIAVWISIFLALLLLLNMCSVKVYGESEFWFSSIKIFTLVGLFILGVVLFFGGGPNHDRLGFRFWRQNMAFKEHLEKGSTGRFLGVWTSIIKAGFSFVCSPESVSVAGSESLKPRRNIPKACNRFKYRLAFFYVFGSLIIGVICSSESHKLLGASKDASASPFVIGIQNAGIPVLNHIINAAILTSALSSGNSFLYAASRTLYSLSRKKMAPKVFSTINRYGVPYWSVLVSWFVGCLAYLNCSSNSASVFAWFTNISTISGFISWIAVSLAYLRWRKAIRYQNLEDRVTYKTWLQPYGTYFVLIFVTIITITNGYASFIGGFDVADFIAAYVAFPIIIFLYVGHKLYRYSKGKTLRFVNPIDEIDLTRDLEEIEEEDKNTKEAEAKNFAEKVWKWVA
ncbi:uncharacterized protein PRCAT00005766001 [Priceomyces carsonii]|uniref:uncharacterized protein n=1 Tax=Priceomyces carsonii TaxID=28549 RepID=UPI002ED95211|nr:unnamed protein product [Priceomyces carsonii]